MGNQKKRFQGGALGLPFRSSIGEDSIQPAGQPGLVAGEEAPGREKHRPAKARWGDREGIHCPTGESVCHRKVISLQRGQDQIKKQLEIASKEGKGRGEQKRVRLQVVQRGGGRAIFFLVLPAKEANSLVEKTLKGRRRPSSPS